MINTIRQQRSIANPVSVAGFGFWSGQDIRIEFRPAPENSGHVFVRCDLDPIRRVPVHVSHRIEIPRRTSIQYDGVRVDMVEHVLAALHGLRIDNCEIWVDAPEMPGCDGSSLAFVNALQQAGIVEQHAPRARHVVQRAVRLGDASSWIEARPLDGDDLIIECHLDYGAVGPIGRQTFQTSVTPQSFCEDLASARTFVLEEEAAWLRRQGLGCRVTCRDLLVFNLFGPIDNPLRFADECVRHKTLDVVGDLALAGCDLTGHVVAHCSGHRLNAQLVASLLADAHVVPDARMSA